MCKINTKQLSNKVTNNLNKKNLNLKLLDDVRNHIGYISSSNNLIFWIMRFGSLLANEFIKDCLLINMIKIINKVMVLWFLIYFNPFIRV